MLKIIKHPLINAKLTVMRNEKTDHTIFRNNLNEIASLMIYEVLRNYETKEITISTPTTKNTIGYDFDKEIIIVPILRAGLGMVHGIQSLVPEARVGHIGIYRDEVTMESIEYFYKMPDIQKDSYILIVDPMLASGGSAYYSIKKLKDEGFTNIQLVCIVGAPEGVEHITKAFPDVTIYLAALDEKLNKDGYIVPGLGDAGDRIFGTK
ncbi:MAG: uracil phosphoribosyltransferase [Metamycoplasmataceae bacterium]